MTSLTHLHLFHRTSSHSRFVYKSSLNPWKTWSSGTWTLTLASPSLLDWISTGPPGRTAASRRVWCPTARRPARATAPRVTAASTARTSASLSITPTSTSTSTSQCAGPPGVTGTTRAIQCMSITRICARMCRVHLWPHWVFQSRPLMTWRTCRTTSWIVCNSTTIPVDVGEERSMLVKCFYFWCQTKTDNALNDMKQVILML